MTQEEKQSKQYSKPNIFYLGAGPGGKEYLTVKADRLLRMAELILLEDKQISPDIIAIAKNKAEIINCAGLNPQELADLIISKLAEKELIIRLISGDPAIFSPAYEEIEELERRDLKVEVVPGVSAPFLLVAKAQQSFTPKRKMQSVILTRLEVNTPLPKGQSLYELAQHGSSLVIYLADRELEKTIKELLSSGISHDSDILLGTQLGWENEEILKIKLGDLPKLLIQKNSGTQRIMLVFPK